MIVNQYPLTIIRGDSHTLQVEIQDNDNNSVALEAGDTIFFSVKESVRKREYVLQKIITNFKENYAVIKIEPGDTKNLRPGERYIYDIQLTRKGGDVFTLIGPSDFTIVGDVTHD